MLRIGFLAPGAPETAQQVEQANAALRKFGWVEGDNFSAERRYADNRPELLPALASDLVRRNVDLIVTSGTVATLAAKAATRTIPIVFWSAADPVRTGLVASLAKPGSNVTGVSALITELEAKRLALLREAAPLQRIARFETANPYYRATRSEFEQTCRGLGVQPVIVEVLPGDSVARAVAQAVRLGAQGLVVGPEPQLFDHRVALMGAAAEHGLPVGASRDYLEVGALFAYDRVESEEDERGASIIDRILRGAKPADVPVEQPTKFELIVNRKVARAIGITIPQTLMLRADRIID